MFLHWVVGKRRILENLWREFFSDPSQWWDHRWQKGNAKHPDFKHKKTQEGLWLDGKSNPPWVESKLAAVAAGALKSSIFSWNSRLIEMVRSGQHQKAMEVFQQMKDEGVELNKVTFVPVLNSCAALGDIEQGRRIHTEIMQSGCVSDVYVGSSLVDMYAKCGSIECAQRVFDEMPVRNVVSWNTMMGGYLKCGQGQQALQLFQQMLQAGVMPDTTTFKAVLNSCANVGALEEGKQVHGQIIARGWESDVFLGSCLIDMYGKCGSIVDALGVFKKLPKRDVVTWSAMIQAWVICGQVQKALEFSKQMQLDGADADPVMLVMLLNACACIAALQEGRLVHEKILQTGCQSNVYVGSSLIDMYAKCGSINDAQIVFESMPERDGVCCAAMLGGYAIHGCTKEALSLFEWMRQEGVEMNMVTFILLLSACSHGALLDEGLYYFEAMRSLHGISATVEHYSCVVDLLGRAGRLHEAEYLIKNMPLEADLSVWISLLSACVIHCNVEMGEHVSNVILQRDPGSVPGHVLLSKIYARTGNWDRSKVLQEKGLRKGVQTVPGLK